MNKRFDWQIDLIYLKRNELVWKFNPLNIGMSGKFGLVFVLFIFLCTKKTQMNMSAKTSAAISVRVKSCFLLSNLFIET